MALFKVGQVVATQGALAFCEKYSIAPMLLIGRHMGGDFGDLDESDVQANVHAMQHDERILSAYRLHDEKLYVITEWDRSVTTLLMASEY